MWNGIRTGRIASRPTHTPNPSLIQSRAELADLQTAGQHDPLTGVTNKKGLEERLGSGLAEPACLVFVDVDGLRRINESHSAAVGDRLLKVVARALTDHCGSNLVSRWDGGTFAVE